MGAKGYAIWVRAHPPESRVCILCVIFATWHITPPQNCLVPPYSTTEFSHIRKYFTLWTVGSRLGSVGVLV